ncbi:MAG: OmpH family outer membrane protein [bacterium]|nr:OmpH family outer membrane protein [bacterium]
MKYSKRFVRLVCFAVCAVVLAAVWPSIVSGQDAGSAPGADTPYKIRVVDQKKVFDGYDKAQAALEVLQTKRDDLQKKIDDLSQSVLDKKKEYEEKEGELTEERKEELEEEFNSSYREYQSAFRDSQAEIDREHAKLIAKSREEIAEAVTAIGNQEKCHLILEGDPKSKSGVLYYSQTIDITTRVIDWLNGAKQ